MTSVALSPQALESPPASSRRPIGSSARPQRRTRLLLIDDDQLGSHKLSSSLVDMGFDIVQAWGAHQGLDMFRNLFHVVDIVLLRLDIAGQDAVALLDSMLDIDPGARVVLLVDTPQRDLRVDEAMERAAFGAMNLRRGALKLAMGIDSLISVCT